MKLGSRGSVAELPQVSLPSLLQSQNARDQLSARVRFHFFKKSDYSREESARRWAATGPADGPESGKLKRRLRGSVPEEHR